MRAREAGVIRVLAIVLCGAGLTACGTSGSTGPESGPIGITVTPGSFYADSGIVRRGRVSWLATATATGVQAPTIRIYRWTGRRWLLQGQVPLSQIPISYGSWGGFRAVSLTN